MLVMIAVQVGGRVGRCAITWDAKSRPRAWLRFPAVMAVVARPRVAKVGWPPRSSGGSKLGSELGAPSSIACWSATAHLAAKKRGIE